MMPTGSNAHPTWKHVDERRREGTRDSIIQARAGSDPGSKRSSPTIHLTRKPQLFLFHFTNTVCQIFGWDFDSDRLAAEIQSNLYQAMYIMVETLGEEALTREMSANWHPGTLDLGQLRFLYDVFFSDIAQKCITTFETNGDVAATSKDPKRAVAQYTAALSLNPSKSIGLFVKRSTSRGNLGLWEDALKDADEVRPRSLGIGGL